MPLPRFGGGAIPSAWRENIKIITLEGVCKGLTQGKRKILEMIEELEIVDAFDLSPDELSLVLNTPLNLQRLVLQEPFYEKDRGPAFEAFLSELQWLIPEIVFWD